MPADVLARRATSQPYLSVESNLARGVLLAAWRAAGLHRRTAHSTPFSTRGDEDYNEIYVGPNISLQRALIRKRLKVSGLAELLPAGLECLPDIAEAAPAWLRRVLHHLEPRNYPALLGFVLRNLDWYLNPAQRPPSLLRVFELRGLLLLPVVLAYWLLQPALLYASAYNPLLLLLGWLIIVALLFWQARQDDAELQALELYLYLRDSYADPREDGAASEADNVGAVAAALGPRFRQVRSSQRAD